MSIIKPLRTYKNINFKVDKHIRTALIVALCVGSVLNLINSFDAVLARQFDTKSIIKITLTYITPFCVSLYSSKKASRK